MTVPPKPIIQADVDPTVTRIFPELAAEIGLNESIVLLQIAYWIKQHNNLKDGQWWTYQSVRDMREQAFKYWSVMTINRVINSLIDKGYINATDEYNEKRYDKTRWFALNVDGLQRLHSIRLRFEGEKTVSKRDSLYQDDTALYQNGTRSNQVDTRSYQLGTTIPETPTETPTEEERESAHAQSAEPSPAPEMPLSLSKTKTETPTPAPARDVTTTPMSVIRQLANDLPPRPEFNDTIALMSLTAKALPLLTAYAEGFPLEIRPKPTNLKAYQKCAVDMVDAGVTPAQVTAKTKALFETGETKLNIWRVADALDEDKLRAYQAANGITKVNGKAEPQHIGDAYRKIAPGQYHTDGSPVYEDELEQK